MYLAIFIGGIRYGAKTEPPRRILGISWFIQASECANGAAVGIHTHPWWGVGSWSGKRVINWIPIGLLGRIFRQTPCPSMQMRSNGGCGSFASSCGPRDLPSGGVKRPSFDGNAVNFGVVAVQCYLR